MESAVLKAVEELLGKGTHSISSFVVLKRRIILLIPVEQEPKAICGEPKCRLFIDLPSVVQLQVQSKSLLALSYLPTQARNQRCFMKMVWPDYTLYLSVLEKYVIVYF